MLTTGFKFFSGLGALLLTAAAFYAWTSGGVDWDLFPGDLGALYYSVLGALTFGWRGGIGDHLGYTVLVGAAVAAFALAGAFVAFRDADSRAVAEVAGEPEAPEYRMPGTPNPWAPLVGFGFGLLAIGLVAGPIFVGAGIVVLVLAGLEWAMLAWSDRATGDPVLNQRLRDRLMLPLEVPVGGVLIAAFLALSFSRAMLAVSQLAAVWLITGIAALIFAGAIGLAMLPRAGRPLLIGAVVLVAVGALTSGVVGLAVGEREFEHHGADHGAGGDQGDEDDHGDGR
jgi:hypothetical protein